MAILILAMPIVVVKSLQYQAAMTSLNGIRFGFNFSLLKAWLNLFLYPLLIQIACVIVLLATMWLVSLPFSPSGMLTYGIIYLLGGG